MKHDSGGRSEGDLNADDSDRVIGDLAHELLDLHAAACDTGVADPVKLVSWMIRFRHDDQDFLEVDPVRYAAALGEWGVAAYRREVAERGRSSFEAAAGPMETLLGEPTDGPEH